MESISTTLLTLNTCEDFSNNTTFLESFNTSIEKKDSLTVVSFGNEPYDIVLGVPHNSCIGIEQICEKRVDENGDLCPRVSDENTSSYAFITFQSLCRQKISSKLVIMNQCSTHDPNKTKNSPYYDEIFREKSKFIVECHAIAGFRKHTLELTAGRNTLSNADFFGRTLFKAYDGVFQLSVQKKAKFKEAFNLEVDGSETENDILERRAITLPEEGGNVIFPEAEKRGIHSFLLEAKPRFRINKINDVLPTKDGLVLGKALAKAIKQYISHILP